MPRQTLNAILKNHGNGSRLGESLQRLHMNLVDVRSARAAAEEQFQAWQVRWLERCEQLRQRIEALDRQLAAIAPIAPVKPQLSVLTAHS
jgi:hypothetical protein